MKRPTNPDEHHSGGGDQGIHPTPLASPDLLQLQADWHGRGTNHHAAAEASGSVLSRELAAVTSVEVGGRASVYAFTGQVKYQFNEDDATIAFLEYGGRGIHVDGPNLGPITYNKAGDWNARLNSDRTFEIVGQVRWSDRDNREIPLDIVLRATLLKNLDLGFLSSTTQGEVAHSVQRGPVLVEVPAGW